MLFYALRNYSFNKIFKHHSVYYALLNFMLSSGNNLISFDDKLYKNKGSVLITFLTSIRKILSLLLVLFYVLKYYIKKYYICMKEIYVKDR